MGERAMLIEHRGKRPHIHQGAVVSPAAFISGDVTIGCGTVVLAGAVITSEGSPVHIGKDCILMEQAVLRGAGVHPCILEDDVLVGPHAHVSGATIETGCFLATGSVVLNGARLGYGSTVAIHGVVHVATQCPPNTFVSIGQVALGNPLVVYSAGEMPQMHAQLSALGFTRIVFGFDSSHGSNADATRELCRRYARSLSQHNADRPVLTDSPGATR